LSGRRARIAPAFRRRLGQIVARGRDSHRVRPTHILRART